MKKILLLISAIAILVTFSRTAESQSAPDATLLTSANILQAIKSMPLGAAVDRPLRTFDIGPANVGIFVVHRPQEPDQGCTIEHDTLLNNNTTSIFFVLDGAGTLITGGTLANPTPISSGDPDLKLVGKGSRGSGIRNGHS